MTPPPINRDGILEVGKQWLSIALLSTLLVVVLWKHSPGGVWTTFVMPVAMGFGLVSWVVGLFALLVWWLTDGH